MTPRSPAAQILATHGTTAAELARRAGVTRQAVSWHLAGGSAAWPNWLLDVLEQMVGPQVAANAAAAADDARQERRDK